MARTIQTAKQYSPAVRRLINKIKKFGRSISEANQLKAKDILCNDFFPGGYLKEDFDQSVIMDILPIILKFLESKNADLQQQGAYFCDAIICTDPEEYIKYNTEKDAVPRLINNLKSNSLRVIDQVLMCLNKIMASDDDSCEHVLQHGADKFNNIVPSLLQHLQSDVTSPAIKCAIIKFIGDICYVRQDFLSSLINDRNYISILYENLQTENVDFLLFSLKAINIIKNLQNEENVRRKLSVCEMAKKLQKLRINRDMEVKNLAKILCEFIHHPQPSRLSTNRRTNIASNRETSNLASQPTRSRKRRANVPVTENLVNRRSLRTSLNQPSNEERDDNNGGDNHPRILPSNNSSTAENDDEPFRNGTINSSSSPIIFELPPELTSQNGFQHSIVQSNNVPANVTADAPVDGTIQNEIIKYWPPHESMIQNFCKLLNLNYIPNFKRFMPKITFDQITFNSRPDNNFTPTDKSGFSCFSILLTGNEDASSTIRQKINEKFIDNLRQSGHFDDEKIAKVIAPIHLMKDEHLETIAAWLKCRILVYCNGWKKYGSWDEENQMIPLFVLNKKENGYQIVLSLKRN